ncbi:MAG: TadE family protein [Bdellovibrionota bacterium]
MKNESGQSLVEFIVVTPVFFIILSGIISIFYLQNRSYMDLEAKISLSMTPFLFEQAERKEAHWEEGEPNELKSILDKSLNPSLAFKLAKDKNNRVFLDKSLLKYTEAENCHQNNTYSFVEKGQGEYQLSTCANENGYEKRGYNFQNILNHFSLSFFQSKGNSLYYPFSELAWPQRSALTSTATREFLLSAKGISFTKNYASLTLPVDYSLFNHQCFMEPFLPQCSLHPYSGKIDRAAKDGANIQMTECYVEMAANCASTAAAYPACIAEGAAEIISAALAGSASSSCPGLKKAIETYFNGIKVKASYDSTATTVKEVDARKNLL